MNKKLIIGLKGKSGTGKDTLANYIVKKYNFSKISFAEPLKKITSIITGWDIDKLDGITSESRIFRETVKHDKYNMTARQLLQYIGTDIFRNIFDENIWVNIVEMKINNMSNSNIIITDVRNQNEIDMILDKGGYIISLYRNNASGTSFIHDSENIPILENEYNIKNDGTIKELYLNFDSIYEKLIVI